MTPCHPYPDRSRVLPPSSYPPRMALPGSAATSGSSGSSRSQSGAVQLPAVRAQSVCQKGEFHDLLGRRSDPCVVLTLGLELATGYLMRRDLARGKRKVDVHLDAMDMFDVLTRAKLVGEYSVNRVKTIMHVLLEDIQRSPPVPTGVSLLYRDEFRDAMPECMAWVDVLAVLYNGAVTRRFQAAKITLWEEDEHDQGCASAISFTGNAARDKPDLIRRMSGFARHATEIERYTIELDLTPNESPERRDSKLCSVLFELLVTAQQSPMTAELQYQMGTDLLLPSRSCRSMSICVLRDSGFVKEMDNIAESLQGKADTPESLESAELRYREQFKQLKNTNDVYFVGLTGEGKSSLINAIFGEEVTTTRDVGVGTTRIEQYLLEHKGKMLRLWDLPGGDDENSMDDYNNERLRLHLKNEQQVSSLVLVNQRGRNLKRSEQKCLLLYKEIFGPELNNILTVVIGRDANDRVQGNPVNTAWMRKHFIRQFDLLEIKITEAQIMFIRPVSIGAELRPPEQLESKIAELKDVLAERRCVFTGYAYWMYTKLLQISDMRDGATKTKLLAELYAQNRSFVCDFLDEIDRNRQATLRKSEGGWVLEYQSFDARKWFQRNSVMHRVDIVGDSDEIKKRMWKEFGRFRPRDAVRIRMRFRKMIETLRGNPGDAQGQLILVRTESGEKAIGRGTLHWKQYKMVDPVKGLSEHTMRRIKEIIQELLVGPGVRKPSFEVEPVRNEPNLSNPAHWN